MPIGRVCRSVLTRQTIVQAAPWRLGTGPWCRRHPTMNRPTRQNKPTLELLEGRLLLHARLVLNGKPINDQDYRHFIIQHVINRVPVTDRRIEYTTPDKTQVVVTLYGLGSLKGSTVSPE